MSTVPDQSNLNFCALKTYKFPSQPTEEKFRQVGTHIWRLFKETDEKPLIANDKLKRMSGEKLDRVVGPPACGPLVEELNLTLGDWVAEKTPRSWLQTIVLPPGDRDDVVGCWAKKHKHQVIEPPERDVLLSVDDLSQLELNGTGVVVIPRLERWFLRHENGLEIIRLLLAKISQLERHCVIGCNSWAWAFLCKAVEIHMIVPEPLTYQPFDAERLYQWFLNLSKKETSHFVNFRLSQSGKKLFEIDKNDKLENDFFKCLAAQSLGIPWVAWHLWRSSIRLDVELDQDALPSNIKIAPDEETLWVEGTDDFILPGKDEKDILMILHALLLHEELSLDELALVVPFGSDMPQLVALCDAGFIHCRGQTYSINPAAYASIRSVLSATGFPQGEI